MGKRIGKSWIVQSQMMKIIISPTLLTHISELFKKAYAYLPFLWSGSSPITESEVLILLSQETIAGFSHLLSWKEEGMLELWQEFKIKKEFEETMTKGLLWFGLDLAGWSGVAHGFFDITQFMQILPLNMILLILFLKYIKKCYA